MELIMKNIVLKKLTAFAVLLWGASIAQPSGMLNAGGRFFSSSRILASSRQNIYFPRKPLNARLKPNNANQQTLLQQIKSIRQEHGQQIEKLNQEHLNIIKKTEKVSRYRYYLNLLIASATSFTLGYFGHSLQNKDSLEEIEQDSLEKIEMQKAALKKANELAITIEGLEANRAEQRRKQKAENLRLQKVFAATCAERSSHAMMTPAEEQAQIARIKAEEQAEIARIKAEEVEAKATQREAEAAHALIRIQNDAYTGAQAIAQAKAQAEAAQKKADDAEKRARVAEAEAERKAVEAEERARIAKHEAWLDQKVSVPGYPVIIVPRRNLKELIQHLNSREK